MIPVVTLGVLGLALVAIGVWGARNAASLPSARIPHEERHRREYVLRRGAFSCLVMGVLCLVAACMIAF